MRERSGFYAILVPSLVSSQLAGPFSPFQVLWQYALAMASVGMLTALGATRAWY